MTCKKNTYRAGIDVWFFSFACCFCSCITWSCRCLDHFASHFCGAHKAPGQPWSAPAGICIVLVLVCFWCNFSGLSDVQEQVNCVRKRSWLQLQPLSAKSSRLIQSVFSVDNLIKRKDYSWEIDNPPPPHTHTPHKPLLHLVLLKNKTNKKPTKSVNEFH